MIARSSALALLTATVSFPLAAQEHCPYQQAHHVEADLQFGPAMGCGGVKWQFGNVAVSTEKQGCPLFVVYTPPHDVAVPSTRPVYVDSIALQPITQVFFQCTQEWFLFFPIGSACAFDRQINVGTVSLLVTRACRESRAP
ncbi:MAG: hypothetical protein FJ265_09815 [Planctomycetes bacterium]|nr:hypothetical protein [Planctomycetota bacterium]